jgi:putative ABC transport system permease protein
MLGHYLKIAVRTSVKHKGHSLINILGLALGMACCLLILLFLRDELSYDRHHPDADRIFRITEDMQMTGQAPDSMAITPAPVAPALLQDFPEIKAAARLMPYPEGALPGKLAISYRNEKQFYELLFFADPSIFEILSLPLVEGDPAKALAAPNAVVISQSAARKYFGDDPALGKVLRIDSGFSDEEYRVTGVYRDIPASSHIHFDGLISFSTLDHVKDQRIALGEWFMNDFYTYVKLAEGASARQVEEQLAPFVQKHFPKPEGAPKITLHLQPVTDIHLRSDLDHELEKNGDISYIYMFSAIAVLTLLIACVNFMNLATARFAGRAREVAVRKVVGARRSQLITQFLGEATLLCAVAMVVAVLLVWAVLPAFNALAGRHIALRLDAPAWLALVGLTLLVGLLAGSYPAFFLSSFEPNRVLRSSLVGGVGSSAFRKVLIVFQFAVSVALLIGVGVVWDQLRYMRSQDLGYDMENVVVLPIRDVRLRERVEKVKAEVGRVPNVQATTFTALIIGRETPQIFTAVHGVKELDMVGSLVVDWDVEKVFKLQLVAGRPLQRGEESDTAAGFLVNEAAVRHWGFASPKDIVGLRAAWGGWKLGNIVGVVRDFHHRPLQFEVEPLVMHVRPLVFHYMYVRIAPGHRAETLAGLEKVWRRLMPSKPFEYFFLDDEFARYYRSEERLGQLLGFFALVTVFVACLGLLGLASFTAEKRTREIGIRKVLGSSVAEVVLLLSKELTLLVIVANVIAWPVAWVLMRNWLQGFAYRTDLHLWSFLLGGLAALLIAWLTVSYQALKAALIAPAEALHYE